MIYASPLAAPGLDPALSPVVVNSAGRALVFRIEWCTADGSIVHEEPATATLEMYRARGATGIEPSDTLEWAEYVPPRTLVGGQAEHWDSVFAGSYSFRLTTIAGEVGATHYRLWVEERE